MSNVDLGPKGNCAHLTIMPAIQDAATEEGISLFTTGACQLHIVDSTEPGMQTTSQTQVCETTSTNPETATRDPASLLSICTDCRYIILEYLLVSPFPIKPRNGNSSETRVMSPRFTDIALVCQKLKEEAYDIFFRKNQFLFESLPVQDPALLLSSDPAPITTFFGQYFFKENVSKLLIQKVSWNLMTEENWDSDFKGHSNARHDFRPTEQFSKNMKALKLLKDNIRTVELIVKVPSTLQLCRRHFEIHTKKYGSDKYGCYNGEHRTHVEARDSQLLAEAEEYYQSFQKLDKYALLFFPLELKTHVEDLNLSTMAEKYNNKKARIEGVERDFMCIPIQRQVKKLRKFTNVNLRWVPFDWQRTSWRKNNCDWFSIMYLRALHEEYDKGSETKVKTTWLDSLGRVSPPVEN